MPPKNTHPAAPETNTPPWLDSMVSPGGPFGNAVKNAQSSLEDSFRAMSDETLQFINRRMEHNSEIIEQCRDCRDMGALVAAQQKWFADLAQDYYDEALRMGEVTRKFLANGMGANGRPEVSARAEKHT